MPKFVEINPSFINIFSEVQITCDATLQHFTVNLLGHVGACRGVKIFFQGVPKGQMPVYTLILFKSIDSL